MSDCEDPSCSCKPQLPRRQFLKLAGGLTVGAMLARGTAFAGPFSKKDFESEVPIDKKLSPEWVKSLYNRGTPQEYRGNALRHIGMPVGGICAGMVYLGGDGKLWHWDIFNQNKFGVTQQSVKYRGRDLSAGEGAAYVQPIPPISELHQGFWIGIDGHVRNLDSTGWKDISFIGQYPVGKVSFQDPGTRVKVSLEAFSPFIPLNEDDSGLPVTLMTYRIENHEPNSVELELGSFLKNPVALYSSGEGEIERFAEPFSDKELSGIVFRARPSSPPSILREDIELENWSHDTYVGWKVEGTAFGKGPVARKDVLDYQGDLGGPGDRVVNTHASAPGNDVGTRDSATGKLTGLPFAIDRRFLNFWIGGGDHVGETCMNLIVDGKIVRTATGHEDNHMASQSWSLEDLKGKSGHLEIVDSATGAWGNIGVGKIWQSDRSANSVDLEQRADYGTMAIASFTNGQVKPDDTIDNVDVGSVRVHKHLSAGESFTVTFAIAWHFPNLKLGIPDDASGRHYAKKFGDARDMVRYVYAHRERLIRETKLWNETWYDGTLPHWFLDRTFANTSTLATTTAHRFATGRFYAWEGIGCCAGTCTHVWHYAHAMGRLFPALERDLRERVDYGIAFHPNTGGIGFRAEFDATPAIDGQAGTILRTYREHQMSSDAEFLKRVWPRVKQAMLFLMGFDPHGEGILSGPQENTLDAAWFGKIAWTSSLYNAALRASAKMADEMGDKEFYNRCLDLAEKGKSSIESQLYNGEYFFQVKDAEHPTALGTYKACHVDQVMGQSWAWQVGLERVLDKDKTVRALNALYKYNFTPDVGPFRDSHPEGRWYAVAGDGGMIMVTNPHHDPAPYGDVKAWQFGYFNECMSGFEHQVASHMLAEGMLLEGLAVTRAIHDRYDASLRNPYNEIECSDHYARAMASYGSFIGICGFEHHGPAGLIGFDPKITPDAFKAPFTSAAGWGSYDQKRRDGHFEAHLTVRWGKLALQTIKLNPGFHDVNHSEVHVGKAAIKHRLDISDGSALLRLESRITIDQISDLRVVLTS